MWEARSAGLEDTRGFFSAATEALDALTAKPG